MNLGKITTVPTISPSSKDVDLRQLVVPNPEPISRKRPSTDKLDNSPAKKSKAEMFDV